MKAAALRRAEWERPFQAPSSRSVRYPAVAARLKRASTKAEPKQTTVDAMRMPRLQLSHENMPRWTSALFSRTAGTVCGAASTSVVSALRRSRVQTSKSRAGTAQRFAIENSERIGAAPTGRKPNSTKSTLFCMRLNCAQSKTYAPIIFFLGK